MKNIGGWIRNDNAVAEVVRRLIHPRFSATPAGEAKDDAPDDIFGWEIVERVSGEKFQNYDQGRVGDCVGFGTTVAVEATCASEIEQGDFEDWCRFSEEVTYGGSRVEIGGGRLGRDDGSVGAWAAEFVTKYGMVPRGSYAVADLSTYREDVARQLGRNGIPKELEDVCREHPVASFTQIRSFDEAWKSIGNLNFIAVCSDVGYEGARNKDGIIRASSSWAHCMAWIGRAIIKGRRCLFQQNSWSAQGVSGPIGYGNHPAGGFWIVEEDAARQISQDDTWAFSGAVGFKKKTIDWSKM